MFYRSGNRRIKSQVRLKFQVVWDSRPHTDWSQREYLRMQRQPRQLTDNALRLEDVKQYIESVAVKL